MISVHIYFTVLELKLNSKISTDNCGIENTAYYMTFLRVGGGKLMRCRYFKRASLSDGDLLKYHYKLTRN